MIFGLIHCLLHTDMLLGNTMSVGETPKEIGPVSTRENDSGVPWQTSIETLLFHLSSHLTTTTSSLQKLLKQEVRIADTFCFESEGPYSRRSTSLLLSELRSNSQKPATLFITSAFPSAFQKTFFSFALFVSMSCFVCFSVSWVICPALLTEPGLRGNKQHSERERQEPH